MMRQPVTISADSLRGIQIKNPPPLGVYVHIPWCVRKCPYCDFNSHQVRDVLPEAEYVSALATDLEMASPQVWGRKIHTVFFGGGTPSVFSAQSIERIMVHLRTLLPLDPYAEVTLEANPGTVDAEKFAAFRDAGVNRLSLGVQSFSPKHLERLGRIHSGGDAIRAAEETAKRFDNFNLDVMYGLPEQTLEEALQDIRMAISLGPTHISAYHLTIEPNTPFFRNPPPLPSDDLSADMQLAIEETLAAAGYAHYETSAFARKGAQCHHNRNYWEFGDYLGLGAGAHSKLSFADQIRRQVRHKHPQAYLKGAEDRQFLQEEHAVARSELPFEFMMNALRLTQGISPQYFTDRTGLPVAIIEPQLRAAEQRGWLERDHQRWRPTLSGQRFLNDLLQLFLD